MKYSYKHILEIVLILMLLASCLQAGLNQNIQIGINTSLNFESIYSYKFNKIKIGFDPSILTYFQTKFEYKNRWITVPNLVASYSLLELNNLEIESGFNLGYKYDSEKLTTYGKNYNEKGFIYDPRFYLNYHFNPLYLSSSLGIAYFRFKSNLNEFERGINNPGRLYQDSRNGFYVSGHLGLGYNF